MFKKVYSLYSAFCTQPAFYSQSAVCILRSVCSSPVVRSPQSASYTDRINILKIINACLVSLAAVFSIVTQKKRLRGRLTRAKTALNMEKTVQMSGFISYAAS